MDSESCHFWGERKRQRERGRDAEQRLFSNSCMLTSSKKLLTETIISLQESMHFNSYEDISLLLPSLEAQRHV
jgi:hypothetical protein